MYSFSEILLTVYTNYWEEHNNPSVTFFFKIGNYPILCVKVMHTHFFYYFILKFEIQLLQVHGSAKVATWSGKYKACDTCNRSVIACANGRQIVFACMVPCCPVVPLTSVVASTSSTRYTEMGWVRGNPSRYHVLFYHHRHHGISQCHVSLFTTDKGIDNRVRLLSTPEAR
jgi:hypothetical protein